MVFIINNKKYDTEKMKKIADVKKWYSLDSWIIDSMFGKKDMGRIYDCELWKSEKGNWLLTHEVDYCKKWAKLSKKKKLNHYLLSTI